MNISGPHCSDLLEFASSLGFDRRGLQEQFLRNPKLDLSCVENSVTDIEFESIIQELLSRTSDHFLGLHYGCFLNIKAMGLIYTISKSALDIEQAILLAGDFLKYTFPAFEITKRTNGSTCYIEVTCLFHDPSIRKHLSDATLCVIYRELKLMTGPSSKIHVHFPHTKINEYKKMLGDDVTKGNAYALSFEKEIVNQSLSEKGLSDIGELLPAFLHLLERLKSAKTFSAKVKKMILSMSNPDLPAFEKVASQFAMSSRSFQRKLTEEDRSFRAISDEIKRDLSKYLRKSKKLRTQDIALLLGYSESSAYLHAAKKWGL